jgi:hypothetical protein
MPILLVGLALFFPRLVIVVLYFLTDWFSASFDGILIPLLGFFIAPVTLFWYAIVQSYFGGAWDAIPVIGLIIAVAIDFGLVRSSKK